LTATPIRCFIRYNAVAVRLERIVHLDSMLVDWHFFDPTRSAIEAELSDARNALLAGGLRLAGLETVNTIDDLEEVLHDGVPDPVEALGFLVKARQPYFQIDGDRIGYSWEVSRSEWFYAPTFEAALDAACVWGQAFHDEAWARVHSGKQNIAAPTAASPSTVIATPTRPR
jgi:hypothetical protein